MRSVCFAKLPAMTGPSLHCGMDDGCRQACEPCCNLSKQATTAADGDRHVAGACNHHS